MKIHVLGDSQLVSSANASSNDKGDLTLIIDAADRGSYFHRRGSSSEFSRLSAEQGRPYVPHDSVTVKLPKFDIQNIQQEMDDENFLIAEVVFEAENDQEAEMLNGIPYDSADRGQFVVKKLSRKSDDANINLASYKKAIKPSV